jgi:ATP sulfurylase
VYASLCELQSTMMVAFEFLSLLHRGHFEISKKTMYTFDTWMIAAAVQCRTIYLCFNI